MFTTIPSFRILDGLLLYFWGTEPINIKLYYRNAGSTTNFRNYTMPFSTAREFIKDINVNSYLEQIVENLPLLHDFAHRVNVKFDDFLVKLFIIVLKFL